jgi:4a-hydroxytetrahydrobiopterin dehydratase
MPVLSEKAVAAKLHLVPGWKIEEGQLVRDFSFANFIQAMEYVNRVAELAEGAGHHPDIDIRYNKVHLALVSHDAGGLTERDFDVATAIDSIQ